MPATRAHMFTGVPEGPTWCDKHMLPHTFTVSVVAVTIHGVYPMGKTTVCDTR